MDEVDAALGCDDVDAMRAFDSMISLGDNDDDSTDREDALHSDIDG